jgi:hypothetical protein
VGEPVVFSEAQAIEQLAKEIWQDAGRLMVSRDSYTAKAVAQLQEPLTQASRDAMKLRGEPWGEPGEEGYLKLVMSTRGAKAFFSERGLTPTVAERNTRSRSY